MNGLRIGGLFEGYGGLTMAARAVLGGELAWYSEIEPAAVKVLEHHHPGVPNLGDITAVDWPSVPAVEVLTGGFPCQDVSSAGRRAGLTPDSRSGLWTHMARAIHVLRPELVVIENVRGLLSADAACDVEPCPWCLGDHEGRPLRALGAVLGDLAVLGYDAQWCGVRASDAGAPHERFRVIVTAWPAGSDTPELGCRPARWDDGIRAAGLVPGATADAEGDRHAQLKSGGHGTQGPRSACDRQDAANAARVGRGEGRPEPAWEFGGSDAAVGGTRATADAHCDAVREQPVSERGGRSATLAGQHGVGTAAADPDCHEREGRAERDGGSEAGQQASHGGDAAGRVLDWGDYGPAVRRWELILGRPAPAPTMTGRRGGQQLAPAFVEWLMGLPAGHVTDVPGLSRNEQLKLLGNGVCPQQAELALHYLLAADASERAA